MRDAGAMGAVEGVGDLRGVFDGLVEGCLNVFGMAAAVDGAYSGFLGKAGTETLPDLQVR